MDLKITEMPIIHLWDLWNNTIVFTTWDEAIFVDKLKTNCRKIFYMYDLDWHESILNTPQQCQILNNVDKVLCRNEDHKDMIDTHFGINAGIMPEYNYEELMNE